MYDSIISKCEQYCKETKEASNTLDVFYRGQARDWELKTSLQRAREDNDDQQIDVPELFWKNAEWNENYSFFENIAHMQHYQKPTRLLDFTTSVDVALYFACSSEKHIEEDGVLYCCSYRRRNCELYDVKLMMEIACLKNEIKVDKFIALFLEKYPEYENGKFFYNLWYKDWVQYPEEWHCDIGRENLGAMLLSWIDHGFMITPTEEEAEKLKDWNPRMYSQKGVFFVQGNKTVGGINKSAWSRNIPLVTITTELADIPSTISTSRFVEKIIIPCKEKKKILKILEEKGIDKKSLYLD